VSAALGRQLAWIPTGDVNGVGRDLYVPSCPPHPLTILDGILRLLDRLPAITR
jgi:Ni,Fe-hydrogenase III small subunit